MSYSTNNRNMIRSESREYYSRRENVERKWISQYGRISMDGDYVINKSCITEVFNMLDVVVENKLEELISSAERLPDKVEDGRTKWVFRYDGREFWIWPPVSFHSRVSALKWFGCTISEDIDRDTRAIRNETVHGNKTVVKQYIVLGYAYTQNIMLSMADALIELNMLSAADRIPSFEKLRISEGETLREGEYLVGPLISETSSCRLYTGTQRRLGRQLTIRELKPGSFSKDSIERERSILIRLKHNQIPHMYDSFYENTTYYMVMESVSGIPLDAYIRSANLSEQQKQDLIDSIRDIVSYVQSSGISISLSTLNSESILVNQDNVPILIDIGLSKEIHLTENSTFPLEYAPPESMRGEPETVSHSVQELLFGIKNPSEGADSRLYHPLVTYCFHCGKELPENVTFCPFCGNETTYAATRQHNEKYPAAMDSVLQVNRHHLLPEQLSEWVETHRAITLIVCALVALFIITLIVILF